MPRILYESNNFNVSYPCLFEHLIEKSPNLRLVKQIKKEEYIYGKPKSFYKKLVKHYIDKIEANGYYSKNWLKDSLIYYIPENEEEFEQYYSKKNIFDYDEKNIYYDKLKLKNIYYNLYNNNIDKKYIKDIKKRSRGKNVIKN